MEFSSSLPFGPRVSPRPTRVLRAIGAAVMLPVVLAGLAVLCFELANSGRIYPGVHIAGVDVGRASTGLAVRRLTARERFLANATVVLSADGHRRRVRAADLGIRFDIGRQVQTAYMLGRHGTVLDRLGAQARLIVAPRDLAPVVSYDRARLLGVMAVLARSVDRPARDAVVALRGGSVVLVHPAAAGRRLDQAAAVVVLGTALTRPRGQVLPLPIATLAPRITTDSALTHAFRTSMALGTSRRLQAGLVAYAHLMTRRSVALVGHLVARQVHLAALAVARRDRMLRLEALIVSRAARLPGLSAGGSIYSVPPDLGRAMLRVAATGAVPRLAIDAGGVERYVATLAASVDRAPRAARLVLRHGHLALLPSAAGLALDQNAATRTLVTLLRAPHGAVVALPAHPVRPSVETADLRAGLRRGTWLLSHPPTFVAGTTRWTPPAGALASALRLDVMPGGLTVAPPSLRHVAAWLAGAVARAPVDASWAVDGQKARVVAARDGLALDERALAHLLLVVPPGTRTIVVPMRRISPHLATAQAAAMGIRTMVGMSYTNFYGSPPNRVTNILAAVRALDGALIPPGAVFSFNKAVGDIDYAHGYVDGISIIDGKDVPGVGGGVCQVAVTIFKAAIYAGLPIVERHPHANVVSYYQPVGMDATIYSSPDGPDVKFRNDTGHWLLMRFAYDVNTAYLEARFYSTAVDQHTEVYGPYYSYYANGNTTAIFFRKVYRHGKKIHDDTFFSEYVPVVPTTP